jgi:hypothetical protein
VTELGLGQWKRYTGKVRNEYETGIFGTQDFRRGTHAHTRARNVAVLFAVFCRRHNRQRKVKANSTEKHIDVLSNTINLTATCFGALIKP